MNKRYKSLSILAALALLFTSFASAAAAQSEDEDDSSIELVSQTSWVTADAPFQLTAAVATERPATSLDVVITVYGAVRSRSAFLSSVEGRASSSTAVILERRPLTEALSPAGTISVNWPVSDSSQRATYLANNGVYPVKVELQDTESNDSVSEFMTHIVKVAEAPNKLNVSTVLPINIAVEDDVNTPITGDEFGQVAQLLTANPNLNVDVAPSPQAIERTSLSEEPAAAQNINALTEAVSDRSLLARTWEDVPASIYKEYPQEAKEQLTRGTNIGSTLGSLDSTTWLATSPINSDAANSLLNQGYENFVVRESNLSSSSRSTSVARPFQLRVGNDTVPAIQADNGLSGHFDERGVLGAHQLLADLAVLWNDYPSQERVFVVEPPRSWQLDPEFLQVYLQALNASPVATAVSLQNAFELPKEGTTRSFSAPSDDDNPSLPSDLNQQRRQLDGFTSMVEEDNVVLGNFQRSLLSSESLRLSEDERENNIDNWDDTFDKQLAAIRLPAERSIRLTARDGEIPISVQNDTGYPVKVNLRLSGDQIAFPEGRQRTIEVPLQQVTDRFAIEARTSGAFPVQVEMTSPDGTLSLYESRVTVRSTATSGVGVFLTAGSLGFLVLWWMHSIYKTRRKRQAAA